jgi:DNA repair photolyase
VPWIGFHEIESGHEQLSTTPIARAGLGPVGSGERARDWPPLDPAMPRPISNPPNPWDSEHIEWLGEPPAARLEVYEEQAKSLITKNDSPDVPFDHGVNPYRGCQHGCAYCYARTTHEFLGLGAGTDFETRIVVKRNAPELLRQELSRRRLRGEGLAFSGATDCYQPLEASYELTRQCLEVCLEFRTPVGIITRGNLVRRDAELLARLHQRAGVSVYISLPTMDARHCRALEPLAPAPEARLETMRVLQDAGVPVGVAIAPVIPGLNEHSIPEILERAAEAGAGRAFMILLRLTRGVAPVFHQRMTEALPERASRVAKALEELRADQQESSSGFHARMRGSGERWRLVEQLFEGSCRRLGLIHGESGLEDSQVLARSPLPSEHQNELFS